MTTITVDAGTVTNRGADVTTVTANGGRYVALEDAAHTTINVRPAGELVYNSDGTLTTLVCGGVADFSQDPRSKTISNVTLNAGFTLRGDWQRLTFSNGIDFDNCGFGDGTLELGSNFTMPALTAI